MGKSSSKFSAESLERLRFGGSGSGGGGGGSGSGGVCVTSSRSHSPSSSTSSSSATPHQHNQGNNNETKDSCGPTASAATTTTTTTAAAVGPNNNNSKSHHQPLTKGLSQDAQSLHGSLPFDTPFLEEMLEEDEQAFVDYLEEIFYQEVEMSDGIQTLFRGNCMASKIMSHCFRTFGSNYIKQLLEPHIKPLSATSMQTSQTPPTNAISYEIDSTRLEEFGNIDVNQKNLLKLTKQILDSILASADDFPPQLNLVCNCLRKVICKKYPNSNIYLKAVGTVILLRFINPAIVSPYEAGLVEQQLPPKTMRGLMLVSKILQNIANNVEFSKEEHMIPFNDFVRTQFEPMRAWVSKISSERN